MNSRIEKFFTLKNHAYYKYIYKKLLIKEISCCVDFINKHHDKNKHDFEFHVNRMFLDDSNKPKNWVYISELLLASNILE